MAEKQETETTVTHNYRGGSYRASLVLEPRMKPKLRVWRENTNGQETETVIKAHLSGYELDEVAGILRLASDEVSS